MTFIRITSYKQIISLGFCRVIEGMSELQCFNNKFDKMVKKEKRLIV
jgi:hypothetical protein